MVMNAGFLSTIIERSFKPNKGIGSISERISPYKLNSFFRMSSLIITVDSLLSSTL
jgi:hypothetical protein